MTVPRIKVSVCATDGYSGMIKKKIPWFEPTWVDFEVMTLQLYSTLFSVCGDVRNDKKMHGKGLDL